MRKDLPIAGIVVFLVGLALVGVSGQLYENQRSLEHRALRVEGTVVRLDSSGGTSVAPVVEFRTPDGATHRVTGNVSSDPPAFEVGESVGVFYEAASHHAVIDAPSERWFLSGVLGILGAIALGIGGAMLAAHRARFRGPSPSAVARAETLARERPTTSAKKVVRIIAAVFASVALVLLAPAALLVRSTMKLDHEANHATGTVVDLDRSRHGARPVVEFTSAAGETIRLVGSTRSSPPAYEIGERVQVLYREASPTQGRIATYSELYLLPTILGGIGGVFSLVAIGLAVASRDRAASH